MRTLTEEEWADRTESVDAWKGIIDHFGLEAALKGIWLDWKKSQDPSIDIDMWDYLQIESLAADDLEG